MEANEFIDKLIEAVLPTFLENIPQEDQYELTLAFYSNIRNSYSDIVEDATNNPESEFIISVFSELEKEIWSTTSVETKKAILLNDENFHNLEYLCLNAFQKAKQRLEDNIFTEEKECQIITKNMEYLIKKVQIYNSVKAKQLYSEAVIDLNYSCGLSDDTSFRISELQKEKYLVK